MSIGSRDPPVPFTIVAASTDDRLAIARELFVEYQQWLGVDLGFQAFDEEVASLPGDYAPPPGRLLLAFERDVAAGCIALRALEEGRCEMKRLYVRPRFQGRGLGRLLATTLIAEATAIGYGLMLLDTLPQMAAAQSLYTSLGFRDVAPYRFNPVPGTRFLALDLHQ